MASSIPIGRAYLRDKTVSDVDVRRNKYCNYNREEVGNFSTP